MHLAVEKVGEEFWIVEIRELKMEVHWQTAF
jgi:hypothetical protein